MRGFPKRRLSPQPDSNTPTQQKVSKYQKYRKALQVTITVKEKMQPLFDGYVEKIGTMSNSITEEYSDP